MTTVSLSVPFVKEKLSALFRRGFFHIFGANVVNKIVTFATNIAIVWFLSKDSYGIFSYANNIYSFALLVTGFGLLSGMFQLCVEKRPEEEKNAVFRYVLTRGLLVDFGLAIAILLVGLFAPLSIAEAGRYLALFAPLLMLDFLFQYASMVLRTKKANQEFAKLQTANTVLYFSAGCIGAFLSGVAGVIIGRYVAYVLSLALASVYLKASELSLRRTRPLSSLLKRDLWGYSIPTQASAGINQMTFLLDVFLIGVFVGNSSDVANYKVATMLPEGMLFIPASLIVFVLPYFVEHNHDRDWFREKSRIFVGTGMILYALLSMLLVFFAPQVIEVLWGSEYLDAVFAFRLLAISFAFSALRTSCTNLLCALRAVRSNLIVSAVSLSVNVVLCLLLIPRYGINGAAAASLAVSVVAAGISFFLLNRKISKI